MSFRAKTLHLHMLFSHVKRSPLLWLHNESRLSQQKYLSEMVWNFIGIYIINRTLHGRFETARPCNSLHIYIYIYTFKTTGCPYALCMSMSLHSRSTKMDRDWRRRYSTKRSCKICNISNKYIFTITSLSVYLSWFIFD